MIYMEYKVIKKFRDKTDNRKLYKKGDSYSHDNEERIAFLIDKGFLEEKSKHPPEGDTKEESDKGIKHTGGGWYELPNGEKIQGKEEAEAALAELESGE